MSSRSRGASMRPVGWFRAIATLVAVGAVASPTFAAIGGASTTAGAAARCKVTKPTAGTRPPKPVPASFNYGNARVAVALNPPNGRIVAGRLPGGGYRATINPDGSIHAKYGWWRAGTRPGLKISGRRLDAPAPPLRASIPDGYYGGFQATGLTFPTVGCWRVTGRYGTATLTFTVLVSKSRLGP